MSGSRDHDERHARISRRAYEMWEADGCPEGQADEYWRRASEIEARGAIWDVNDSIASEATGPGALPGIRGEEPS